MAYIFYFTIFLYTSYALFLIARKLNDKFFVLAWVPVINDYYVIKLAKRPFWYWPLLYIPVLNFYISYIIWRDIAKRFGMSFIFGFLMIIPVLNWFIIGLYAFVFKTEKSAEIKSELPAETPVDPKNTTAADKSQEKG